MDDIEFWASVPDGIPFRLLTDEATAKPTRVRPLQNGINHTRLGSWVSALLRRVLFTIEQFSLTAPKRGQSLSAWKIQLSDRLLKLFAAIIQPR
jgi:hypothetical protein